MFSYIFKLIQCILNSFRTHLSVFYFDLDPIKDVNSVANINYITPQSQLKNYGIFPIKFNIHYLTPFLLMFAIDIDSLYVIFIQYGKYNDTGMPELFTHKITPMGFWDLSDIIINTGIAMEMFIYINLSIKPQVAPNLIMYVVQDAKSKKSRIYYNKKCMYLW